MTTRAIRNNNPGNIRVGSDWQGQMPRSAQTPEQLAEHEFVVFETPAWGFRAMAIILRGYFERGVDTLRKIITTWAPPSENDTDSYVRAVAATSGLPIGQKLSFDYATAFALLRAIAKHEAGSFPNEWRDEIHKGLELAGIKEEV